MPQATESRVTLPARYRIVRHIADGGMASVWAAEDELLGRLVAVKVLAPAYAVDERAGRRFKREARAGAKLSDCPNVVTVYDIGEHAGRAFMVMEHRSGGTVADRLRSGQPIPRPQAVQWLREAALALDCAHRHHVVHRDVKPANLLLDEHGSLAVGDFGIATVASEASVTQTGQVLGTAAYISPEQAMGEPATDASDRYALAVVAYELLTGRRPFEAHHPAAQARAHVESTVPLASRADDGLPDAVDGVLQVGLAKAPAARPASAARFVDLLEAALGDEAEPRRPPVAATAATAAQPPRRPAPAPRPARPARAARPPRPLTTTPPGPASRRRALPFVLALAALALAAAVFAIATTGGGGGGSPATTSAGRTTSTAKRSATSTAKRSTTSTTQAPATSSSTPQAPATSSPQATPTADPGALNDQGKALIDAGRAAAAIAPLQQSVEGYRQQQRTGELGYAFALYNLGNALRLAGRPAEAVPLLQERLRVSSNQRGAVQRELKLAQREAGQGGGNGGD